MDDVGAAWWRTFPAVSPAYGFVAPDVPELTIGVLPAHRGRGVGTALLRSLVAMADDRVLRGLSLSVEEDNPAVNLYRRAGFGVHDVEGGALTMVRWRPGSAGGG